MELLRDRKVKVLLAGFVLSLVALVVLAAFGLLAVASALAGAASGASLLFVAVEAAAPFVAASLLVGVLSVLLFVATTVAAVRRVSMPRSERLARAARLVERVSGDAREFGLAERFEPSTEERVADLKRAYVEGEITEWEYERRLEDLLDDERESDGTVRRERGRLLREYER